MFLLIDQVGIYAEGFKYDIKEFNRTHQLKYYGGVLLGFGLLGTASGTGLVIVGNVMKNKNKPGYFMSYNEATEAKEKWEKGDKLIGIGGICYGIGIPMFITGAIMRGVAVERLKKYKKLSLLTGPNYMKFAYNF